MPSKTSTAWLITISTADFEEVDMDLTRTVTQSFPVYYMVKEFGNDGSHPHLHIYVRSEEDRRQDSVRRQFLKCVKVHTPHCLDVRAVTDHQNLIGRYFQKDTTASVIMTTFTDSEITTMKEHAKRVVQAPMKTRNVGLSTAADTIIKYAKAHDMPYDSRYCINCILNLMYRDGFRFTSVLPRLRFIAKEIECLSGRTTDFFDGQE